MPKSNCPHDISRCYQPISSMISLISYSNDLSMPLNHKKPQNMAVWKKGITYNLSNCNKKEHTFKPECNAKNLKSLIEDKIGKAEIQTICHCEKSSYSNIIRWQGLASNVPVFWRLLLVICGQLNFKQQLVSKSISFHAHYWASNIKIRYVRT